jgi:hypothetical protein
MFSRLACDSRFKVSSEASMAETRVEAELAASWAASDAMRKACRAARRCSAASARIRSAFAVTEGASRRKRAPGPERSKASAGAAAAGRTVLSGTPAAALDGRAAVARGAAAGRLLAPRSRADATRVDGAGCAGGGGTAATTAGVGARGSPSTTAGNRADISGGSANKVNRRDTLASQPAVTFTVTTGSSILGSVRTTIVGTPPAVTKLAPTEPRGTGASPIQTSAETHSASRTSDGSSRRPTENSKGAPSVTVGCARAKPSAIASLTPNAAAIDRGRQPR